jgi:tetratricopeptide (TPR) repeat protein
LGETAALLGFAQRPEDVPAGEKDDAKARAGKWFAAAVECFRGQPVPAAIRDSQATLAGSQPEPDLIVDDESSRATFLRGVAQFVSGRYPAAVQQFEAVTRAHADHYGAQFLLGRCHFELGEHARAQERFDMARALAANDYRPAYNRGLSLLQIGRNADAEEEFTAVIVQNPTYAPAYFERAMARQLSKPKDALADLARAADLGGETAPLLNVRVRVYTELHNEPAAEAARQAILKFHAKTAIDYTILGYTLQNKKRWAEALEAYRKASDLNPTDFISWYNQATVIEKSHGKSEDMIVVLNKAVTASPKSSLALVGRGLTYARLGNREEAIKDVEKGLQMTEHLIPTTIYHAACAYALTSQIEPNDADRAVNLLRWAAKAGFHRWDIMESDTDLEAVQNRDDYKRIIESIKELVK